MFAVVQFEYTTWAQDGKTDLFGKLPSPIAVLTLDQDPATGKLSLVKDHNVDTAPAMGLWITCGSSLSPWGTHLSSEEYEPDAFTLATNSQFKAFSKNLFGDETKANMYHYGHLPEVTVNPDGTGSWTWPAPTPPTPATRRSGSAARPSGCGSSPAWTRPRPSWKRTATPR